MNIKGKVAIAIENPESTSSLSEVFGRCNYFFIYDIDSSDGSILKNPYADEIGSAGIQAARMLIENSVSYVITKQIGQNPLRFLFSAGINVFQSQNGNADEVLKLFLEGILTPLEDGTVNNRRRKRKRYSINSSGNIKNNIN